MGLHCWAEREGGKSTWCECVIPILPPCSLLSSSSLFCPVCAGVTLPVAPAKPAAPLGPFGEGSKAPASLCQHSTLQSLAEIPGTTKTHALWDVPPPGQPLYGALPSGYPSSQKLTGKVHAGEHGGIPAGRGGTGRRPGTRMAPGHGDMALVRGAIVGMAWGRCHSHPHSETSSWLWQGQTCWRSTWWRSAACASASRSPSAPMTGSGSSWNAAWPPPARPVVWVPCGGRGCWGALRSGWGGQPLHTPLHGEGTYPVHGGASGEETQHWSLLCRIAQRRLCPGAGARAAAERGEPGSA